MSNKATLLVTTGINKSWELIRIYVNDVNLDGLDQNSQTRSFNISSGTVIVRAEIGTIDLKRTVKTPPLRLTVDSDQTAEVIINFGDPIHLEHISTYSDYSKIVVSDDKNANAQTIVELEKQLASLERTKHEAEITTQKEVPSNLGNGILICAGILFISGLIFLMISDSVNAGVNFIACFLPITGLLLAVGMTIRFNAQNAKQSAVKGAQQRLKTADEKIIEIRHKLDELKMRREPVTLETSSKRSKELVQTLPEQFITEGGKTGQLEIELRKAQKMVEDGLISNEEFQALRKKLIESM